MMMIPSDDFTTIGAVGKDICSTAWVLYAILEGGEGMTYSRLKGKSYEKNSISMPMISQRRWSASSQP
jgi:hypothetical protein